MIQFLALLVVAYVLLAYVYNNVRWERGRQQHTIYYKLKLWSFKIWKWGFDAYILKYPPHASLTPHVDGVENGEHWRMNITLKGRACFSVLKGRGINSYGRWITTQQRVNIFRPDKELHTLLVDNNTCIKLSLGYVKFK